MDNLSDTNSSSASTTWGWRYVKIGRRPQGPSDAAAAGVRSRILSSRNPRDALTISVKYRGGNECWWEIKARGTTLRVPGHLALHDVLMSLSGPRKD